MLANNKKYPENLTEKEFSRFWSKVNKDGPWPLTKGCYGKCWIWTSSILKDGYGDFHLRGVTVRAHRLSYISTKGYISKELVLDHLCRNRACVNPDHLEPVTQLINAHRGDSGINHRAKINCPRGHRLVSPNLVISGKKLGYRNCLSCHRTSAKYKNAKVRKGIILDPNLFQQVADEYYKELMS